LIQNTVYKYFSNCELR